MKQELIRFSKEVVRFEKKKLILPIIAVLVLFTGVFVLEDMRSKNIIEDTTDRSVERMTDMTVIFLETGHFNDSINYTEEERKENWDSKDNPLANYYEQNRVKSYVGLISAGAVYYTPLYPVVPARSSGASFGHTSTLPKITFYGYEKGYVLTDDVVHSLIKTFYRQEELGELGAKVNNSPENWTLEEFRAEVSRIRNTEVDDPEIREDVLNNPMNGAESGSAIMASMNSERYRTLSKMAVNNELKEVQPVRFIPAAVAAFTWTYILSGLFLLVFRRLKTRYDRRVNAIATDNNFVNENLHLTMILFLVMANVSLVIHVFTSLYTLVGEITFVAGVNVFSVVYFLIFKKLNSLILSRTRYSYFLTGLGMSVVTMTGLMAFIWNPIGYGFRGVLVMAFWSSLPLLFGLVAQYNQIHGEHFLEKLIAN